MPRDAVSFEGWKSALPLLPRIGDGVPELHVGLEALQQFATQLRDSPNTHDKFIKFARTSQERDDYRKILKNLEELTTTVWKRAFNLPSDLRMEEQAEVLQKVAEFMILVDEVAAKGAFFRDKTQTALQELTAELSPTSESIRGSITPVVVLLLSEEILIAARTELARVANACVQARASLQENDEQGARAQLTQALVEAHGIQSTIQRAFDLILAPDMTKQAYQAEGRGFSSLRRNLDDLKPTIGHLKEIVGTLERLKKEDYTQEKFNSLQTAVDALDAQRDSLRERLDEAERRLR